MIPNRGIRSEATYRSTRFPRDIGSDTTFRPVPALNLHMQYGHENASQSMLLPQDGHILDMVRVPLTGPVNPSPARALELPIEVDTCATSPVTISARRAQKGISGRPRSNTQSTFSPMTL